MSLYAIAETTKHVLFASEDTSLETKDKLCIAFGMTILLGGAQVLERVDWRRLYQPTVTYCTNWMLELTRNVILHKEIRLLDQYLPIWMDKLRLPIDPYELIRVKNILTERVNKLVLNGIFSKHIVEGDILELGSGITKKGEVSYLAHMVDNKYRSRFVYSEKEFPFIINPKKNSSPRYLTLDATELKETLQPASYDNIVALSVVDCIAKDLFKIAEGANHALKPGGKMIILSNLPFHKISFFEKHHTEGKLIIPFFSKNHVLSYKKVSIEVLKVHAKMAHPSFFTFIEELLARPPIERFIFLIRTIKEDAKLGMLLANICPADFYEDLNITQSYLDDLYEAFSPERGFKVVAMNFASKEKTYDGNICLIDRTVNRKKISVEDIEKTVYNFAETDPRFEDGFCKMDSTIPLGQFNLKATIFVFVAIKQ